MSNDEYYKVVEFNNKLVKVLLQNGQQISGILEIAPIQKRIAVGDYPKLLTMSEIIWFKPVT